MLPWPHPDHLAFRRVEAILSEYAGQNHPIAQRRFPFSFNVEDQYSQGQTTPARKTQGGRQMEQASRTPPETEKPNIQPQVDDASQGYSSTKPAIDLLGSDEHGEHKPPISSDLPLLPQLLRSAGANPTQLNAPSHQAAAPPPTPNTGVETNVEVYPPGRGSSVQVAPGEQFSAPGPDKANDSGHRQLGSNTGAPGAMIPISNYPRSPTSEMGSRGRSSQVRPSPEEAVITLDPRISPTPLSSRDRSSQVPPGPKEAEIRLDSQIPPIPPPNTASVGVDKQAAAEFRSVTAKTQAGIEGQKGTLQKASHVSFCPIYASRLDRTLIG